MMFEHWCWSSAELKSLSLHYTRADPQYMEAWLRANPGQSPPPEKLPDDAIEKQLKNRATVLRDSTIASLYAASSHDFWHSRR